MPGTSEEPLSPRFNRLLGGLSEEEYEELSPFFQRVTMLPKESMVRANEPITVVDFPLYGVASQLATMKDGTTVEVGPIGREGTTGLPLFLGASTTPIDTLMQIPGESIRLTASAFRDAIERSAGLRRMMQLYAESTVTSMAWWVACNRVHVIEQRLARWLLMSHDRVLGDQFELTHEFLAYMMGVRRASVTEAAGVFQDAGLIRYQRGVMSIVDRAGLEQRACECYWVVTREWDRLLGTDFLASNKRAHGSSLSRAAPITSGLSGERPRTTAQCWTRSLAPGAGQ